MKIRKLLIPLTICSVVTSTVFGLRNSHIIESTQVIAGQELSGEKFIELDNWLYSGKGIQLEFTFDIPSSSKTNKFSLLHNWDRLTDHLTLTFDNKGGVSANKGNVFKLGDKFYYQFMMSDLSDMVNSNEGAKGTETVNKLYFSDEQLPLNVTGASIIESNINAFNESFIRDDEFNPGMKFKAYIPSINETSTYGMIIVPNQYVARYNTDYLTHLKSDGNSYIDLRCSPAVLESSDSLYKTFGKGYFIQGSLTGIKEEHYQLPFCAIPYEKTSAGNYKYANFVKLTKSNYYDLCLEQKNSSKFNDYFKKTKDVINQIITKCEVHSTTKTSSSNVTAYFAYNSEQILKDAPIPEDKKLNFVMQAAKNEKETCQLILNTKSSTPKKYYVNFEPLVNTSDSSKRIPSSAISVQKQLYQNVDSNWKVIDQYNMDYYINGHETPELGWWPDALLPFDLAIDSGENVLSNEHGANNGLVFTVNVPENAAPGIYTSNIVIRILNEDTLVIPFKLEVFDFALGENHSKFTVAISTTEIGHLYSNNNRSDQPYKQAFELLANNGISGGLLPGESWSLSQLDSYIDAAKKYTKDDRIGAYYLPTPTQNLSGTFNFTFEKSTLFGLSSETKNHKVTLANTPVLSGEDYLYEGDNNIQMYGCVTMLTKLVQASTNEVDLLKKAIVYHPQADEPGKNESSQLQNILNQNCLFRSIEKVLENQSIFNGKENVKNSLKNLAYIVTSHPRGILKGIITDGGKEYAYKSLSSVSYDGANTRLAELCYCATVNDIKTKEMKGYCPTFDCFQRFNGGSNKIGYADLMSMLSNKDEYTIWWYGCCQPVTPYASAWVNAPMIRWRANKWLQYSLGVQGELYYMSNRIQKVFDVEGQGDLPLSETQNLNGEATYNGIHGDGQLMFPVHNMYKDIDPSIYWLASLRLENLGEANDDYNYLYYLSELIENLSSSEQESARATVNACINALTSEGPYKNTTDSNLMYQKRSTLGHLIEDLL